MDNIQYKLLVVEDDEAMRNILSDKAAHYHYEVTSAEDGEVAVRKVVEARPHLILLDLMLPKLDGFGVLETIRKYPDEQISRISVVVLSNLWSNKDILRAKALQIDEYFVKANTDLEDLFRKVKSILEAKIKI